MSKIVIYNESGVAAFLVPAPEYLASLPETMTDEEKLVAVANKDLPDGTTYEIIDDSELPSPHFRNDWRFEPGSTSMVSRNPA